MPKCPNGHDSTWDDFCSSCGEPISTKAGGDGAQGGEGATTPEPSGGESPAVAAPDAGALSCPNCAVSRSAEDVFCENCGYDFASGSLPGADEGDPAEAVTAQTPPTAVIPAETAPDQPDQPDAASGTGGDGSPEAAEAPAPAASAGLAVAVVEVDADLFERVAAGGELTLPDDREPAETRLVLKGDEVLVGRRSDSRGVYPEIDLSPPTDDPAVSHRHAMLRRSADGEWTVTDLESTNGSYLGDDTSAMSPGKPYPLPHGTPLFVGAWTRITLELP
jgi:hypothetical protein